MSTSTGRDGRPGTASAIIWGAAVVAVAATAYATFGPDGERNATSFLLAAGLTVLVAVLATVSPVIGGTPAVIASAVAMVMAVSGLHWTGVPVVLGAVGAAAGLGARSGDERPMATVAVVLGVVAILVALGIVFLEPLTD